MGDKLNPMLHADDSAGIILHARTEEEALAEFPKVWEGVETMLHTKTKSFQ